MVPGHIILCHVCYSLKLKEECNENVESCKEISGKKNTYNENVNIKCIDGVLHADKQILIEKSKYFQTFFESSMNIGRSYTEISFAIKDMETLISYLHNGKFSCDENYIELLHLADYLQIPELKSKCEIHIKNIINVSNCLFLYENVLNEQLEIYCLQYALEKAKDVFQTDYFIKNVLCSTLKEILSSSVLNIDSENDLFEAIKNWYLYNENRFEEFSILCTYINTNKLSAVYEREISNVIRSLPEEDIEGNVPRFRAKGYEQFMFIIGGMDNNDQVLANCECFSLNRLHKSQWRISIPQSIYTGYPDGNKTMVISSCTEPRAFAACAFDEEEIYLFGGNSDWWNLNSAEVYSIRSNKWRSLGTMPIHLHGSGAALVGNKIYIVGGFSDDGVENICLVYNIELGTWQFKNKMLNKRCHHSVTCSSGYLYVTGGVGTDDVHYLNSCEKYCIEDDAWAEIEPLNTPRAYHSQVLHRGCILAIGGFNGVRLDSVEKFDLLSETWIEKEQTLCSVKCSSSSVSNNEIVVIAGGQSKHNAFSAEYIRNDICHSMPSMRIARHGHCSAILKLPYNYLWH